MRFPAGAYLLSFSAIFYIGLLVSAFEMYRESFKSQMQFKENHGLHVSIWSTCDRMPLLINTLFSLFRGSVKPDRIGIFFEDSNKCSLEIIKDSFDALNMTQSTEFLPHFGIPTPDQVLLHTLKSLKSFDTYLIALLSDDQYLSKNELQNAVFRFLDSMEGGSRKPSKQVPILASAMRRIGICLNSYDNNAKSPVVGLAHFTATTYPEYHSMRPEFLVLPIFDLHTKSFGMLQLYNKKQFNGIIYDDDFIASAGRNLAIAYRLSTMVEGVLVEGLSDPSVNLLIDSELNEAASFLNNRLDKSRDVGGMQGILASSSHDEDFLSDFLTAARYMRDKIGYDVFKDMASRVSFERHFCSRYTTGDPFQEDHDFGDYKNCGYVRCSAEELALNSQLMLSP